MEPDRADHSAPGRDALDRYYTPRGVALSLIEHVPDLGLGGSILEPSAGAGAWVHAIRLRWPKLYRVHGHDVDPGADGLRICDSSSVGDFLDYDHHHIAIIGNPPYAHAEQHVRHALTLAPVVCFLLRLAFLEGQCRAWFWRDHPAAKVVVLSKRPSFTGGATDSCAYGFFIWDQRDPGPTELVVQP